MPTTMEPLATRLRLRTMGVAREVVMDANETARLAADCRRVAAAIDGQVATLLTGRYRGVQVNGSAGYRRAVEVVAARLTERAGELRGAAHGLVARSSTIAAIDDAAAHGITGAAVHPMVAPAMAAP